MSKLETKRGLDPVLVLFLGLCPALGATADLRAALGMGAAALLVSVLSSLVLGALRKAIPEKAWVPAVILVCAGFASLTQLLMAAFLPQVSQMLGVYLAVIAVDLLVFSGAEKAREGLGAALKDSLKNGLCFLCCVLVLGAVRELLGSASIFGAPVAFLENYKISLLTQAHGGLVVLALLLAAVQALRGAAPLNAEGVTADAAGLDAKEE